MIAGFFLRLIVAYAALMAAWPLLKGGYTACYRGTADLLLGNFGSRAVVHFERPGESDPVKDTVIHIKDRQSPGVELTVPVSARYTAYMPTAFTIALILATPLAWRDRLIAALIAVLLVQLFILAWLSVSLLDELSNPSAPLRVFMLTGVDKTVLRFIISNVVESVIFTAYVAPLFVWIITVFRRKNRALLLRPFMQMNQPADALRNEPDNSNPS